MTVHTVESGQPKKIEGQEAIDYVKKLTREELLLRKNLADAERELKARKLPPFPHFPYS